MPVFVGQDAGDSVFAGLGIIKARKQVVVLVGAQGEALRHSLLVLGQHPPKKQHLVVALVRIHGRKGIGFVKILILKSLDAVFRDIDKVRGDQIQI